MTVCFCDMSKTVAATRAAGNAAIDGVSLVSGYASWAAQIARDHLRGRDAQSRAEADSLIQQP